MGFYKSDADVWHLARSLTQLLEFNTNDGTNLLLVGSVV
jgi:hypothetical protein